MNVLDSLKHDSFSRQFLEAYLDVGFANLPKREIDLLVLRLLLAHVESWSEASPPSAFYLARTLRVKRSRIRAMLDELSFRNSDDEESSNRRLRYVLSNGDKDLANNKVKIQIEDGYLREYAKSIIQADFGIVDTSFDRSVIRLSGEKFLTLVTAVMAGEERKAFLKELDKYNKSLKSKGKEDLLKAFLQEFVKSAGKQAGEKTINLGAAVLTGGLSEIGTLIASFFNREADVSHTED